ncbi:helix-turn-helix domain-containing protein [Actinomadura fibrosa]|uniref:Helix-turn-helix domain-containing protein n=1 Tax=Actinomadura fibrosa TaxID=111802 RepID=A0ABW2XV82_9ACTN|nr:helix-turn-helix transcriptional regulator [Actinomadura fibrosa]
MDHRAELRAFLRERRARLRPDDVGLRDDGRRRRVPGLRREEVARLAGVSVDYYVHLEQGRARQVSDSVLDAVARALRLTPDEHAYLKRLAHPEGTAAPKPQRVLDGVADVLAALHHRPAYVVGRRTDVLAWNQLAAALFADFTALRPAQRNMARLVFTDPAAPTVYRTWSRKADDVVAYLRFDAARHPGDPALTSLIDELSAASPDFRRRWAAGEVRDKRNGRLTVHHPAVGDLEIRYETLRPAGDPDQALIVWSPTDERAATALTLLGTLTAEPQPNT